MDIKKNLRNTFSRSAKDNSASRSAKSATPSQATAGHETTQDTLTNSRDPNASPSTPRHNVEALVTPGATASASDTRGGRHIPADVGQEIAKHLNFGQARVLETVLYGDKGGPELHHQLSSSFFKLCGEAFPGEKPHIATLLGAKLPKDVAIKIPKENREKIQALLASAVPNSPLARDFRKEADLAKYFAYLNFSLHSVLKRPDRDNPNYFYVQKRLVSDLKKWADRLVEITGPDTYFDDIQSKDKDLIAKFAKDIAPHARFIREVFSKPDRVYSILAAASSQRWHIDSKELKKLEKDVKQISKILNEHWAPNDICDFEKQLAKRMLNRETTDLTYFSGSGGSF